jgi:ABC-type transport system involved in multi-copper enzyme maturation permease subunit
MSIKKEEKNMLSNVIITEYMKYKRTFLPWMILSGALSTSILGIFMGLGSGDTSWNSLMADGFGWLNVLNLMIIPVLTGYIFAGEYMEGTARVLFTYPIARWKFYVAKCIVISFGILCLYIIHLLFTFLAGSILTDFLLTSEVFWLSLYLIMIFALTHLVTVPITALICVFAKWSGASILAGAGYLALYVAFGRSGLKYFFSMIVSNTIKDSYLIGIDVLTRQELTTIFMTLVITLLVFFPIGMICYIKTDV